MKEGAGTRVYARKGLQSAKPRRDNVAELIRALMDGPKTVEELAEFVELSDVIIREWCRAFHEAGVIRICDRLPGNLPVYEHQASPFAKPDVPRKSRRPSRNSMAQRALVAP